VLKVGALGALVAFTVGNSRAVAIGYAGRANAAVASTQTQDNAQVIRFDIPAGTLEESLNAFQLNLLAHDSGVARCLTPGISPITVAPR
jgi:hypothetical protein